MEYALTEKGTALLPIIDDMRVYGERWIVQGCGEDRTSSAVFARTPARPRSPEACNAALRRAGAPGALAKGELPCAPTSSRQSSPTSCTTPRHTCRPRWTPARRCRSSSSRTAARRQGAGPGGPLYCYRPLTGAFIGERWPALADLESCAAAERLLECLQGLDRYLLQCDVRIGRGDRRSRATVVLRTLLEEAFAEHTSSSSTASGCVGRSRGWTRRPSPTPARWP